MVISKSVVDPGGSGRHVGNVERLEKEFLVKVEEKTLSLSLIFDVFTGLFSFH